MREIKHWRHGETATVAESKGGVLVTAHPAENVVRAVEPWPTPELLQKYYASSRFRGKTPADSALAASGLGYYSDLQSLNSEDAITWSFFGNLAYASSPTRLDVLNRILEAAGLPTTDGSPICWLWRRLPHPEKPESNGGPEMDFGFLTKSLLVLGEAKWNSKLGQGQGVARNRSQLYLRAKYCDNMALHAHPTVRRCVVLGVGRNATVFDKSEAKLDTRACIRQLSWDQVCRCFPEKIASELEDYLAWKSEYSRHAP